MFSANLLVEAFISRGLLLQLDVTSSMTTDDVSWRGSATQLLSGYMPETFPSPKSSNFYRLSVHGLLLFMLASCGEDDSMANQRPIANAGNNQRVEISTRVVLDGSRSSDPDQDRLSYQWTQRSGQTVELMDTTGEMVTFIAPSKPGKLVFELVTSDGTAFSAPDRVEIQVYQPPSNREPMADAGMNMRVIGGTRITLDGSASSDPDGDRLDYIWTQISGTQVQLNNDNSAMAEFIAPNENADLVFSLTVNDGELDSAPATVNVKVRTSAQNQSPIARAGEDRNAGAGVTVVLDGSASSDPEGQSLSYLWTQVSGNSVNLNDPTSVNPSFQSPTTAGRLSFQLVVNDGVNDSAPDTVEINVLVGNQAPVAVAGPNQTVLAGATVYLDASSSYDPNGDPLTATWTFTSTTNAPILAQTEGVTTRFRAPNALRTLEIQLTVSDGVETSTPAFVQITVSNRRPSANAGDDFSAEIGTSAQLNGQRSADADRHNLTPMWTQVSGTPVSLTDTNTLRPGFVVTSTGPMVFELVVNDGQVDSGRDQVTVYGVTSGFVDTDNDFLSDDEELALGTNPNNADTDRDGIPDGWEVKGHEEVDFPALGANPRRRNIFVEIDYQHYTTNGRLDTARPSETWKTAVRNYLASLDIPNHDGTTGIDIEFFEDSQLDADFKCYYNSGNTIGDISPARFAYREAFHKATFCIGGGRGNSPIGGRSLKFTSARTNNTESDDLTERAQFSRYFLFLHELGHSLGLLHGGNVNMNRKPNYTSLMNYEYDASFNGSPRTIRGTQIHFSEGNLPELDECNLQETNAMASVPIAELSFLQFYGAGWRVDANHNIDWNRNNQIESTPYSLVLRLQPSPTGCRVLRDHNDLVRIQNRMARALPSDPN